MTPVRLSVSVRDLAEFVWRRGDLGPRAAGPSAQEGAAGHSWLQARRTGCRTEVMLAHTDTHGAVTLTISGRADVVCETGPLPVIEEIKTTLEPPLLVRADNPVHWAQAKLYGFIYARERGCEAVELVLTYLNVDTRQTRAFRERIERETLEAFYQETAGAYLDWMGRVSEWREARNASLTELPFLFETPRPGQMEIADAVTSLAREGERLFLEAPTGSGKTAAVLYGALKGLLEEHVSQVVFLSAKTVGQMALDAAAARVWALGARINVLTVIARERECLETDAVCRPELCPLAKGHFDRLLPAMVDAFSGEGGQRNAPDTGGISREGLDARIASAARRHAVCVYWLKRALIPFADVVAADYNYFFDPGARLSGLIVRVAPRKLLLVDEAHNLPERARQMFSATLSSGTLRVFEALRRGHRGIASRAAAVRGAMARMPSERALSEPSGERPALILVIEALVDALEMLLGRSGAVDTEILSGYFELSAFLRAIRTGVPSDVLIRRDRDGEVLLTVFCVDPAPHLQDALSASGARALFFSATLSPLSFYSRLLAGQPSRTLRLPPHFPPENRCVVAWGGVSTRFRDRDRTAGAIADAVRLAVMSKPGNYLVFFPSFAYLERVAAALELPAGGVEVICQRPHQSDAERRSFLSRFAAGSRPERRLLGMAVLGGIFGEGVDLPGKALIGAVMVSPGLPKVTAERELIRRHFAAAEGQGFEYAYLYPGMNKVIQAAGRVIRGASDRGIILFVGERFGHSAYRSLLVDAWPDLRYVGTKERLSSELTAFWSGQPLD